MLRRDSLRPSNAGQGSQVCLEEAKADAGKKDVCVVGGGEFAQQCLKAGVLDEIRLHLAPLLLSAGTRLFDHIRPERLLEKTSMIESPLATHLTFRVNNGSAKVSAGRDQTASS